MWRLLEIGDVVKATDEAFQNQLGWCNIGKHSPYGIGVTVNDKMVLTIPIRRKVSADAEDQQKLPANIDYTAALEKEAIKWYHEGHFLLSETAIKELASRLNSVIKAQQNCA